MEKSEDCEFREEEEYLGLFRGAITRPRRTGILQCQKNIMEQAVVRSEEFRLRPEKDRE